MKVLWQESTGGACLPYDKTKHANSVYKFLYWRQDGEVLLAGPQGDPMPSHSVLHRLAGKSVPGGRPDGAGGAFRGRIISWESVGYEVMTPEELRPKIAEALGLKII